MFSILCFSHLCVVLNVTGALHVANCPNRFATGVHASPLASRHAPPSRSAAGRRVFSGRGGGGDSWTKRCLSSKVNNVFV